MSYEVNGPYLSQVRPWQVFEWDQDSGRYVRTYATYKTKEAAQAVADRLNEGEMSRSA